MHLLGKYVFTLIRMLFLVKRAFIWCKNKTVAFVEALITEGTGCNGLPGVRLPLDNRRNIPLSSMAGAHEPPSAAHALLSWLCLKLTADSCLKDAF